MQFKKPTTLMFEYILFIIKFFHFVLIRACLKRSQKISRGSLTDTLVTANVSRVLFGPYLLHSIFLQLKNNKEYGEYGTHSKRD